MARIGVRLNPLRIRERFRPMYINGFQLMHSVLIPYESGSVSDLSVLLSLLKHTQS